MPKPDGMSDADFVKLHNETAAIFDGAVGFAALQQKDFATAQKDLREAVGDEIADRTSWTSIPWPRPIWRPIR